MDYSHQHNTFNIDPTFSVYNLVKRVVQRGAMLHHRKTMTLISYEIENATIVDSAHNMVFSGFQRFSRFLPQLDRYKKLANQAQIVYVFGIADVEVPAIQNIVYVPLKPTDLLAKEWFVISYGSDYMSALATSELTDIDDPDPSRVFEGVWTFDLDMVSIIYDWLCREVNNQSALVDETQHHVQTHVRLISNSVGRLLMAIMEERSSRMAAIVQAELKTIIKDGIYSALQAMSPETHPFAAQTLEEKNVAVLFSDLRSFTAMAQTMSARELVENIINPYMQTVSRIVYSHGGEVDKFLGDGVLAVFGLRNNRDDNLNRAVSAAQKIVTELAKLPGHPPVGIGIDYGQVIIGEIGIAGAHTEETVIGDVVNTAQRLSSLGVNDIYVSEYVANHMKPGTLTLEPVSATLKGKVGTQSVYRIQP